MPDCLIRVHSIQGSILFLYREVYSFPYKFYEMFPLIGRYNTNFVSGKIIIEIMCSCIYSFPITALSGSGESWNTANPPTFMFWRSRDNIFLDEIIYIYITEYM